MDALESTQKPKQAESPAATLRKQAGATEERGPSPVRKERGRDQGPRRERTFQQAEVKGRTVAKRAVEEGPPSPARPMSQPQDIVTARLLLLFSPPHGSDLLCPALWGGSLLATLLQGAKALPTAVPPACLVPLPRSLLWPPQWRQAVLTTLPPHLPRCAPLPSTHFTGVSIGADNICVVTAPPTSEVGGGLRGSKPAVFNL